MSWLSDPNLFIKEPVDGWDGGKGVECAVNDDRKFVTLRSDAEFRKSVLKYRTSERGGKKRGGNRWSVYQELCSMI